MNLKKLVADAFKEATEEVMNGETAVNLEVEFNGKETKVTFDIDLDRGGIDSYYESSVTFKNGEVTCRLGESLEGSGIEELVEENLKEIAHQVIPPLKKTLGKVTPEITISTAEFIRFIEKNSDMEWNEVCKFVNKEGYLSEDCSYGHGQGFYADKPDSKRVKKHGYDYEYEFLRAHPQLDGYSVNVVFDD